jgi:hypothetical protein
LIAKRAVHPAAVCSDLPFVQGRDSQELTRFRRRSATQSMSVADKKQPLVTDIERTDTDDHLVVTEEKQAPAQDITRFRASGPRLA